MRTRPGLSEQSRTEQLPTASLFVLIGGEPRTSWLPAEIQLEWVYIRTGRDVGERAGRFPAPAPAGDVDAGRVRRGDARYRSIKRVASAVGDGGPWCALPRSTSRATTRTLTPAVLA